MDALRTRMNERPVVGTFVKLPRREIVDVLALIGIDFVVCDYEHSQIDQRGVLEIVLAGRAAQLPVLVRLPELDRGLINRVLEAGAAGIQLARANAETAPELSRLLRYPPLGTRSISLVQPAAAYGTRPLVEHIESANTEVLAVGQFETKNYADSLDQAVAALDVAFIGPVDLSVDLDHPGDFSAQPVEDAIAAIEAAAARSHTPMGRFAASADEAKAALNKGYRYLVVSSDLTMLMSGARQAIDDVMRAVSS